LLLGIGGGYTGWGADAEQRVVAAVRAMIVDIDDSMVNKRAIEDNGWLMGAKCDPSAPKVMHVFEQLVGKLRRHSLK
jgi:hypothetical protein